MRCPNCGANIIDGSSFCERCGSQVGIPQFTSSQLQPQRTNDNKVLWIVVVVVLVVIVLPIVLSAVMYFMVLGFGGTSSTTTPAATYAKSTVEGGCRINIIAISKTDVAWDDIRVQLSDETDFAEWRIGTVDLDAGYAVTASYDSELLGTLSVSLTVTDVSGNGFVNGGDSFTVTANPVFSTATTYSAALLYEPTGERIGTGATFNG